MNMTLSPTFSKGACRRCRYLYIDSFFIIIICIIVWTKAILFVVKYVRPRILLVDIYLII